MDYVTWSWVFLVAYMGAMLGIGVWGTLRVKRADDYATARGSYGPVFLAFAFAATTASGATFLGGPGLAYTYGVSMIWGSFLYPMGVYFGVLIAMRLIATAGHRFGNRSIPEYLGDRFQSDALRIVVSVVSLVLFFYIAGQLVSGLVMFETMLGFDRMWALVITTVVLLVYVSMGGAHADILTDGVQGLMMLGLAILVIILFVLAVGFDGGLPALMSNLTEQDEHLTKPLNTTTALAHSWWSIVSVFFAHIPLGLLPHLGNKLWALKRTDQQYSFVKIAFACGLTLGMMSLAGLLTRGLVGEDLFMTGTSPNAALPVMFIEIFPTWLAALIGVGVLAAIMSTADGLVVSSSQIIANDLYRRSILPRTRYAKTHSEEQIDKQVLTISRVSTVVVLILCAAMAWMLQNTNIALIIMIGTGGMMAAFSGPLVVSALWRGVTKSGAFAGLLGGFIAFIILHAQLLNPAWFGESGVVFDVVTWLYNEGPNPFSCAALGEAVSVSLTYVVSKLSKPLPEEFVRQLFEPETDETTGTDSQIVK